MSTFSVAEAMEKLDELIDRVLKNETIVIIAQDGRPVAELKPILQPEREAVKA
jgi:antitoxin (DNA-binding transcriptional repressor) of toxin-antitoxin stability system